MTTFFDAGLIGRVLLAQAEATGAPASGAAPAASPFSSMLPLMIIFFGIMYFLMIRPQQKRDRERRDMLGSLTKGDAVVTSGGVCGTIVGLSDTHAVLKVDDNVTIEFIRSAIAQVTSRPGDKKKQDQA